MTHQIRGEMSRSAFVGVGWVAPPSPEARCASLASYGQPARKGQGRSKCTPLSARSATAQGYAGDPTHYLQTLVSTILLLSSSFSADLTSPGRSSRDRSLALCPLVTMWPVLAQPTSPNHECTSCLVGVVLIPSTHAVDFHIPSYQLAPYI